MNRTFRTMLFASALLPVSAFAQDATTQPADPQTPVIVEPQAGGQDATGTMQTDMAPGGSTAETAPLPGDEPAMENAQEQNLQAPDAQPEVTVETVDPAAPAAGSDMAAADDPLNGETFVTVPPTGAWRVADLVGKDVYGSDGEDIGEINDVIVSQDGRVSAVIVGVGGFLGIGEKDVAVSMTALEFGPGMTEAEAEAVSDATTATGEVDMTAEAPPVTPAPGEPATTGAVAEDGAAVDPALDVEIGDDALPTRIVLAVTREELENAPTFEGIRPVNAEADAAVDGMAPAPAPAQ